MKRKINLVGQNTLTVSLPKKWVEKNNIKKGDEIELNEDNNKLIICSEVSDSIKEISFNITPYGNMIGRVVGALYKSGYDKIHLTFDNPEILNSIKKELTKGFIGMDMINHTSKSCVIESMAKIDPTEFSNAERRVFRLLIENCQDGLNAFVKKDYAELSNVASRDININKFSDFARRLLNKYRHKEDNKTSMVYFIMEDLENIGDDYRDMFLFIQKNKLAPNKKIISIFEKVNKFIESFYELYYSFTPENYSEFGAEYTALISEIEGSYKTFNGQDLVILLRLQSIATAVFDLNGPLITSKV